jgi:hypothetical protein
MERVAGWQLTHIVYEAPLPAGGTQPVTQQRVARAHRSRPDPYQVRVTLLNRRGFSVSNPFARVKW